MARPIKEGLDYFPFDVDFFNDIKVRRLIRGSGTTSSSILICLLCNIYQDKGYYIEWNEDLPFLIADTIGVSEGAVEEVIKKAIQVGFFDENIHKEYNILTSVGIQSRYATATERRKKIDWISEYVLIDVIKKEVDVYSNRVNVDNNPINDSNSTQRKVKESKVNTTSYNPSSADTENTWRDSFEIYKSELVQEYEKAISDDGWLSIQERYNPKLDIKLTLEKACYQFWATDEGWKHKKKSKSTTINWRSTLMKSINQPQNKVYKS